MNKGRAVDVASLDFSKAFDAVSHCFLFPKLAEFWLSKWGIRLLQIKEPVDMLEDVAAVQAGLDRLWNWEDRNLMMFRMGIMVDNTLNMRQ